MSPTDKQNLFTGFSTADAALNKNWTTYDIDLIKTDLYNHFNTRVGERRMLPRFGCRIWNYLMEPNTSALRELIVQEAIRICETDPRVQVEDVDVFSSTHGIRVSIKLKYVPFAVVETFVVDFNQRAEY